MEVEAEAPPPPSLPQPQSGQLAGAGAGAGAGGDEEAALLMSKAPSMSMLNEKELLRQHREAGRRTIQNFLRSYKCYDVVRQSGKVVVFDTNIPFQLAFYALVEHDTQVAPLWDSGARKFVGIMVITDFIDTVRDYYKGNVSMAEVATKSIAQVVRDPEGHRMLHSEFAHGVADDSIYHACELIVKRKLRYLPIVNPEQQLMLSVLSQLDILGACVSYVMIFLAFELCVCFAFPQLHPFTHPHFHHRVPGEHLPRGAAAVRPERARAGHRRLRHRRDHAADEPPHRRAGGHGAAVS